MRSYLSLALLAAGLLAVGCSSSNRPGSKVSGKVLYNGNPVAEAKVVFTDGKSAGAAGVNGPSAITDEAGNFVMVGVPPGTYKVVVYKLVAKSGAKLPPEGEGMDITQIEASGIGQHALPKKYADPATTTLTANVESGATNVGELKLEGKAEGK